MRDDRSGKIVKGPVTGLVLPGSTSGKPVSSIPAKYETILFKGPRERKGFGSEERRFNDPEHDLPGPGSYSQAMSMEFKHDSIGKKGFGSMASSGTRFKNQRVRYTGPGPADYKQHNRASADFNYAAASAAFQSATTTSLQQSDSVSGSTPGPGAYTALETRHGERLGFTNVPGARSAFRTTARKLELSGNPEAPAPTAYDLGNLWDKPYRGSGASHSSSFAPRSHMSHSEAAHSIVFQEAGKGEAPDTGPGPGSYETQDVSSIRSTLVKSAGRLTSCFKPAEFVDRMGRPLNPARSASAGPGPGSYNVEQAATAVLEGPGPRAGVSAPFISQSRGHTMDVSSDAPGPAYYGKTMPPHHKSFHLNAQRNYVTRT